MPIRSPAVLIGVRGAAVAACRRNIGGGVRVLAWLLALGVPASAAVGVRGVFVRDFNMTMGGAVGAAVLFFAALVAFAVERNREAHAEYMADCQRHRSAYECTLLWKAAEARRGSGGDPLIIPVPIPMR